MNSTCIESTTPFKIYRRKSRGKYPTGGIYYVQLKIGNSNSYCSGKSTGFFNKTDAMRLAWKWTSTGNIPDRINGRIAQSHSFEIEQILAILRTGIFKDNEIQLILDTLATVYSVKGGVVPSSSAAQTVKEYLTDFYNPDKSKFLKEMKYSGKDITKSHLKALQSIVNNYWIPKFGDREIGLLSKNELQEWLWELKETKINIGKKKKKITLLSHSYINRIVNTGIRALKYAYECKQITNDCFTGLIFLKSNPKKREILESSQVKMLFEKEWSHPLSKLANITAMLTGLRQGEIGALRLCDLKDNLIYVRHNYSRIDGLKCTKNGHERIVPANELLIKELRKQGETNPYKKGDEGYIFWNTKHPDKPFDVKVWCRQLKIELQRMGVKNYQEITFHSWRHFYTTGIEPQLTHSDLQKVTGHLTEKMLEHYANHQTSNALKNVGEVVDKTLLQLSGLA